MTSSHKKPAPPLHPRKVADESPVEDAQQPPENPEIALSNGAAPAKIDAEREVPPATCGTCIFFVPAKEGAPVGFCRRNAPTPLFLGLRPPKLAGQAPEPMVDTFFPMVNITVWCGEYHPHPTVAAEMTKQ